MRAEACQVGLAYFSVAAVLCLLEWSLESKADSDTSVFPYQTDKTTTMPLIAFAMRTCSHMLENFEKGVHKRA